MEALILVLVVGVVVYFMTKGRESSPVGTDGNRYPILKPEMFEPRDQPITTAQAKKLYKEFLTQVGYFKAHDYDRNEIAYDVEQLVDAINEREESLKFERDNEVEQRKEALAEAKEDLKEAKRELKSCKDDAKRAELEADVQAAEEWVGRHQKAIDELKAAPTTFKADKREFLIDYINRQLHGDDWKSKAA